MARLGDICTRITDGSHNPPQGISHSEYLMLSSKNIYDDEITLDDPRFLSAENYETENKRTQISTGDILLTIVGTVGRAAVVPNSIKNICLQRSVAVIKPKSDLVDSRFLMYQLQSMRTQLEQEARGVAQKGIYLRQVENLQIKVPSRDEQLRVVKKLDKVSKLIALWKEQLAKLDQLVKSRFIELFGDLASPECKWKVEKLVDACVDPDDIKCGPFGTQLNKDEYQSDGVAVWEIPQINSRFSTIPTHYLSENKAKQLEAYSIIPGDIAMSRKGNVGKCAVFPSDFEAGIIHSDVLRIRVDSRCALPVFMMHQLHYSRAVQHQIELVSSGAIMAGINVTKLKQILVHIPPLKLQEQFVAFVEQTDKSKLAIQQSLDKLELLKKSLMQQYFS